MPVSKKTSWAQLRVGILALVALALVAVLIMLLSGENPLFRSSVPVYTYYGDAAAITSGAPVRLNGILVGKVGDVDLSNDPDPNRTVRITLEIDEGFLPSIPVDSQTKLAQTSLLSARYVNIKRGMSADTVQEGAELGSEITSELQDLFETGNTTLAALQSILKRVESLVIEIEDGQGTIGRFIRDPRLFDGLVDTVDEMNKLVVAINNPNSTIGRLINEDTLYNDFRGTISRVDMLLDSVTTDLNSGEGTLSKLLKDDSLHEEVRLAIADLRETLRLVNSGDGTIGKLMTTDTLHVRLEQTMSRLDTVLDHLNSGEGTMGQLLLNPQLYESLDGTMNEVHALMRDFRADPKKFLTIRLTLF